MKMKEAKFYSAGPNATVQCHLCPHGCRLKEGDTGICRVRQNTGGVLEAISYGHITSWGIDPVEKKPLYHFYPGSEVLSVGTYGCSFSCQFCQNWSIVHETGVPTLQVTPEELVERCLRERDQRNECIGLAFTYSEPLVWYEYVGEAAQLAKTHGLKTVLITNGYVQQKPWEELLPYVDAANLDVKSFRNDFYRSLCRGSLTPVKQAVQSAYEAKVHVEITTLLVEGLNDSEDEIQELSQWLSSLNAEIPLHLSRYFPAYQMDRPATSLEALEGARRIARQHLDYVYLGNVWGMEHHSTYCPKCDELLIRRKGLGISVRQLQGRRCQRCGWLLPIVGEAKNSGK